VRVEIPRVGEAAELFVSELFPRGKRFLRPEPLEALVIGAFVRWLSMRDPESLCEEAGLGQGLQIDGVADLRRAARAVRGVPGA
jgi:hypothetical protein